MIWFLTVIYPWEGEGEHKTQRLSSVALLGELCTLLLCTDWTSIHIGREHEQH